VLPPGLAALLERASGLAISLEPAGGSPTGQPTGPVLYTAPLVSIWSSIPVVWRSSVACTDKTRARLRRTAATCKRHDAEGEFN